MSVTNISAAAATMTANVSVHCGKSPLKDTKDSKDGIKDTKERKEFKEIRKDIKDSRKEFKELKEGGKDFKELKEGGKDIKELKEGGKDIKERKEGASRGVAGWRRVPGGRRARGRRASQLLAVVEELSARVAALEDALSGGPAQAFIGPELRPDLAGGPQYGAGGAALEQQMQMGDPAAKRAFDSLPG